MRKGRTCPDLDASLFFDPDEIRGAHLRVNSTAWIGGDYNRLWIYAEANKPNDGKLEGVDVQFLYGRLVAPFWDLQAGLRYTKPGTGISSHTYAVVGVQGLAPYRFGVQAAAFLSERGKVSGRASWRRHSHVKHAPRKDPS